LLHTVSVCATSKKQLCPLCPVAVVWHAAQLSPSHCVFPPTTHHALENMPNPAPPLPPAPNSYSSHTPVVTPTTGGTSEAGRWGEQAAVCRKWRARCKQGSHNHPAALSRPAGAQGVSGRFGSSAHSSAMRSDLTHERSPTCAMPHPCCLVDPIIHDHKQDTAAMPHAAVTLPPMHSFEARMHAVLRGADPSLDPASLPPAVQQHISATSPQGPSPAAAAAVANRGRSRGSSSLMLPLGQQVGTSSSPAEGVC